MKNELKVLHGLAAISIIGGLIRVFAIAAHDVALRSNIMSQYLLWAILFEIVALNIKD